MAQTITYHHASAGYPVKDTWIKTINVGNYTTWPGLTAAAVRKHFPESNETQKRHMKRQRQGVRSTKVLESIPEEEDSTTEVNNLPMPHKPKKMKDVYIKIHMANETMYTDQPG